jgi:lysophospholipase L1-like esterase
LIQTIHSIRRQLVGVSTLIVICIVPGIASAQFRPPQPAEVPDAVRMQRPTSQAIEMVQSSLDDFVGTVDPATRAILDRYPGILEVRAPGANTAIIPSLAQGFRAKHENNLEVARQGDIELLLMGDSITDFWRNAEGAYAGKPVLDEYFGQWKIANFGIAGDTTEGVLFRLNNGEGEGFSPRAIMLMIGTNNTRRNTAAEIAEGVGAIVLELQNDFPEAKILLLAVFPRGDASNPARGVIAEINETISRLDDGESVHYLDIGEAFLDENGDIPTEIMSDGLHPSTAGYRIWAEAVREPLTELMGGD